MFSTADQQSESIQQRHLLGETTSPCGIQQLTFLEMQISTNSQWESNAVANLHTGIILNFSNQIQLTDGVFTNDGGLTHSGGINIGSAGSIVLINSARMNVTSGNMTNYGTIDICGTCCMSSNGNWRNMASGIVTGTGAVNSGGNLQNSGIWDVNVSWCATGAGLGLPTAEDCATATGICFCNCLTSGNGKLRSKHY